MDHEEKYENRCYANVRARQQAPSVHRVSIVVKSFLHPSSSPRSPPSCFLRFFPLKVRRRARTNPARFYRRALALKINVQCFTHMASYVSHEQLKCVYLMRSTLCIYVSRDFECEYTGYVEKKIYN